MRFCLVAAAISFSLISSEPVEHVVEEALSSNDECARDGSCALNALQYSHNIPNASEEELPPHSPQWLNCDPLCPEMPVPYSQQVATLGASPEEDLGTTWLRHRGANCWYACGRQSGECSSFCGNGNACCRWRARHDPPVCDHVKWWPVIHWHTCVTPSKTYHQPTDSGSGDCANRAENGEVITVYHQTGCDVGPKILQDGFRLGRSGWCGGGIYFARSPDATKTKAVGPDSHKGFMIEARVRIGRVAQGDKKCAINGRHLQGRSLLSAGYDSIEFDPGDGQEVIVYCSNQVISTKSYPWKCSK
mmetsp:Transcript_46406/g.86714  ORF Transcript_46406/g.86714 Transcript_46406/m.86714 type:complete len:304 (+) Transcript_46406:90-1001(+)